MIDQPTMIDQPKKRGGDTRLAAERNGKKVGPRPKTGQPFPSRLTVYLSSDQDELLADFAAQDGVSKQDLVRLAISRYLTDRLIV